MAHKNYLHLFRDVICAYLELSQDGPVEEGIGNVESVRVDTGDVPLLGEDETVEYGETLGLMLS